MGWLGGLVWDGGREFLRVGGTQRSRVAYTAAAGLHGAHAPLVLAGGVAFVVLSGAAEVGGGGGLVGGHGCACWVVQGVFKWWGRETLSSFVGDDVDQLGSGLGV